ncbi:uncharacterized protein LOC142570961 [Dermacentor variabilis]|uniref:uncharacterized protein LOC142570961 n=1 Tax=Dermacentor variabilis TaxID=34621 RepID=UPI003F5B5154
MVTSTGAMAICQTRTDQQPDQAWNTAPSACVYESADTGDIKRTGIINDGFDVIPVPGTAPPVSDLTPNSILFPGLPRPFGQSHRVICETVCAFVTTYSIENKANAEIELQPPRFLYYYITDVLETIKDAQFLQYPTPGGFSVNVRNKNRTRSGETDDGVGNGGCGDALLNARDTDCCSNAQLDHATNRPAGGRCRLVVTTCAILSVTDFPTAVAILA